MFNEISKRMDGHRMKIEKMLLELANKDAISGREAAVRDYLLAHTQQKATTDAFGNLYFGDIQTKKPKVALYAHMDEVGFFVKEITEKGFLYFSPIGGWWGHVILGQKVRITSRKNGNIFTGIVGTLPKNSLQGDKLVPISEMYIDLGATSSAEIVAAGIQVGDMIVPATEAQKSFNGKMVIGKALDNRVGCTIVSQVVNQFVGNKIELIGVATVQEEAGTRGSKVIAPKIDADINIVLDVANGKDTPYATSRPTRVLGKGPGLVLADKTALGAISLIDFFKNIAEEKEIPYQYDLLNGGGTDAGSVQLAQGKPTMVLCVPVRYCHSWHSIVCLKDVEASIRLLLETLAAFEGGKGLD